MYIDWKNKEGVEQGKKQKVNSNVKSLYSNSYVKSGILIEMMWIQYVNNVGIDVNDSRTYGNYKNSEIPANVAGNDLRQVTGYSEYWK